MGPTKKLTSIDSTIGKNSKAEIDNQLTSQTSQENEKFKNKTRDGITRRNAILRKVKELPPINESGMTDKLSDSTNGLKKIPKPLPKPPSKNTSIESSNNSAAQKSKPLPDTPIKSKPLPATPSRKMQPLPVVSTSSLAIPKPLPVVSTSSPSVPNPLPTFPQQIMQSQPQPRLNFKAIPIKNLPVTEMNKQIESFRNATEREGSAVTSLLIEKLNYHVSNTNKSENKTEEISAQICKTFAKFGQRAAGYKYNPKQEIKEELVKFALAWLTMKIEKKDVTLTSWDDAIDNMAMSVFNKSKEWGMEF